LRPAFNQPYKKIPGQKAGRPQNRNYLKNIFYFKRLAERLEEDSCKPG
jgi:hypothetical protein